MIYVDASAIGRLLLKEPGITFPRTPGTRVISSEIVQVELTRALDRAALGGRLTRAEAATKSAELAALLDGMSLVPVSRAIIARAGDPFPVPVRALDAIHVSTAEWVARMVGAPLEFWTHDKLQANAALCRGLPIMGL